MFPSMHRTRTLEIVLTRIAIWIVAAANGNKYTMAKLIQPMMLLLAKHPYAYMYTRVAGGFPSSFVYYFFFSFSPPLSLSLYCARVYTNVQFNANDSINFPFWRWQFCRPHALTFTKKPFFPPLSRTVAWTCGQHCSDSFQWSDRWE